MSDAVATTAETWDAESGSFTYDANGNILTAPAPYSISAAIYNYQNLPVSLTRSGVTTTYRYDDAGERITKLGSTGNTEVYLRDGATTLGVFTVNGSGTLLSWYFNLVWDNRVVGRQPNTGNRDYYHFDILGSTRAVTQGLTITESHDYDPWGLEMPARGLGSGTKEAFSGKEQDAETGLDYFGARYYMPALGVWAAVDPAADGMAGWSAYNYVYDNPGLRTDPDGRQTSCGIGCEQYEGQAAQEYFIGLQNKQRQQHSDQEPRVSSRVSSDPCNGPAPGYGATQEQFSSCMASKLRGPERLITWWWFVESLVLPLEEGSGAIAALRLGASRASLVRAAVEEAVRIGAPFKAARQGGQLVRAVARAIGAKGLSQAEAVRAIEQALGRLEFESGRLIKDGVVYLAPHSVVEGTEFSAVAVAADGSVGMARLAINGIKVEVVTPAAH